MKKQIIISVLLIIVLFGFLEYTSNPIKITFDESTTQAEINDAISFASDEGVVIEIDSVRYNDESELSYLSGKVSSLLSTVNFSTEGEIKAITIDKSRGGFFSSLSVRLKR